MEDANKTTAVRICKECGRRYVDPKKVKDALKLIKTGVSLSVAARVTGVSKQLLSNRIGKGEK